MPKPRRDPPRPTAGCAWNTRQRAYGYSVFDRREHRNSLDIDVLTRLAHELALIRNDSAVRSVILTGANGAFSSGADFALIEHLSQRPES